MVDQCYPALPEGQNWPAHMIGDAPIKASLRETFAKISHQVAANVAEEKEKICALAWCRANGNPHLLTPESDNEPADEKR